jgi:hypothetical protein
METKRTKHEINSSDWPVFCQRVSEQRAGAIVKLELFELNGVKARQIESATFQSMVFDGADGCNNVITFRLRDGREIVHEILDPIQIRLNPSEASGDFNPLEIKAENGMTTVTFHPAIHEQMLVGLRTA